MYFSIVMMKFNNIKFHNNVSVNYNRFFCGNSMQKIKYASIPFYFQFKKIPRLDIKPNLNIFCQIKISEPDHSKILANLLDPSGTHGHGCLFLNLFLDVFFPELPFNENEHWTVTHEKERYDIRIKNIDNSKIIIIENKAKNARDTDNQLYRYWYKGIFLPQYNRKKMGLDCFAKIIYLSPSDYKQPEEQSLSRPNDWDTDFEKVPDEFITIRFFNRDIVKWLDMCIMNIEANTNVYYYLIQYRDFWR